MEKYRRVEKPKAHDTLAVDANEIRITQQGNVRSYISYANGLFADKRERSVVLKAMGNAISKAVSVAELLKLRVVGLHQITRAASIETVDVYEPLEEGLDRIETTRHIPSISIQLSLDALNKHDLGYQSPIPAELVTPAFDDREPRKTDTARGASARKISKRSDTRKSKGASAAAAAASVSHESDSADQENSKRQANTPSPRAASVAATTAASPRNAKSESESESGSESKPAREDEVAKRGRRKSRRGGAGRKARTKASAHAAASLDESERLTPRDAQTSAPHATVDASSSSLPASAAARGKTSRPRKPRAKRSDHAVATHSDVAPHEQQPTEQQAIATDGTSDGGDTGARASSFRGRGRGRGSRGRGGRGATVTSEAAASATVASAE